MPRRRESKLLPTGKIPRDRPFPKAHPRPAEKAAKLEMAPMVERIADQLGHDTAPGAELIVIGGIAGDVFLRHTAGAHGAPFVMVAVKPDLGDIGIALILSDLARGEMAVIVDDGQIFRIGMIKCFCCRIGQQKVITDKVFHHFAPRI